ncbi:hypothetical protein SAMD00019534_001670 [Acytostelium subglobosum LB1]|uniref:hypothetical protein n=1 Tax=Acytostelium subglobosum LB1 TaxID=1410327 RepID=UPI000644B2F1|nr:hypothetical protein SAMD00019534_001670 [Acytostelium subglobosum LB1]GAM16992.1 hypothetical protein SAMD00019534_001670 [Acytostelium subglobosum LB1]|eukprot:XP_012759054.1 hypothetical protein SAMD00019534_001670 [Acytostelium subglobosum LB1]
MLSDLCYRAVVLSDRCPDLCRHADLCCRAAVLSDICCRAAMLSLTSVSKSLCLSSCYEPLSPARLSPSMLELPLTSATKL